jgi:hypothetical protein
MVASPTPAPGCPATACLVSDDFSGAGLGPAWTADDINAPSTGSESVLGGALAIQASGSSLPQAADALRFIHQPVSGDFDLALRVQTPASGGPYPAVGLMFRANLDPSGPYQAVAKETNCCNTTFGRAFDGGPSTELCCVGSGGSWVRMSRTGNYFQFFDSMDGAA